MPCRRKVHQSRSAGILLPWSRLVIAISAALGLGIASAYHAAPGRVSTHTEVTVSYQQANTNGKPIAAFLGDSYTSGSGASEQGKRWTSLVAGRLGWIERNFGAGSTGYWQPSTANPNYLGRIAAVAFDHPDIVVIAGGQNDLPEFDEDLSAVAAAVTDTYSAVRAQLPNARIVAVGPSSPLSASPSLISLDLDVQAAARAVDADYVSLISPTPVIRDNMVVANGHMDDFGHAAIAERIVAALS